MHKKAGLWRNWNCNWSLWTFLLVNLFLLLPACPDRPCLEDRGKVQRVQRTVELGLRHILQRDNQESLMPKVSAEQGILNYENTFLSLVGAGGTKMCASSLQLYQRMAVLRSLCSLHMEKLRWFCQRYPLTVHSLFPPLYKELFASEADLLPGNSHWWLRATTCTDNHMHTKKRENSHWWFLRWHHLFL